MTLSPPWNGSDPWFGSLFAELAGVRVFSINYRLAPENPIPSARDDAWSALNWLADHRAALETNLERIAIGRASAGNGLTTALATYIRHNKGIQMETT